VSKKYTDEATVRFNAYVQETYPALARIAGEIDGLGVFNLTYPEKDELLRILGEICRKIETLNAPHLGQWYRKDQILGIAHRIDSWEVGKAGYAMKTDCGKVIGSARPLIPVEQSGDEKRAVYCRLCRTWA
jgi:hypothetical protein